MRDLAQWSEQDINILRELRKSCLIHLHLQSQSAYYFHMLHNFITIPNILMGAVLSVSLFSVENERWRLASGILAVSVTFLSSLNKQLAPGEKSQLHCFVARQYERIYRDIRMNVNMLTDESQQRMFITTLKSEVDKIFGMQPDPPMSIMRHFEKRNKKSVEDIMYPEMEQIEKNIIDDSQKITNRVTNRMSKYIRRTASFKSLINNGLEETSQTVQTVSHPIQPPVVPSSIKFSQIRRSTESG